MKKFSYRNKGFSLLELLVVIAIIGTLSAIGIPAYIGYVSGAQKTDAQNSMQSISMVEEEYKTSSAANNYYKTDTGSTCTPALSKHGNINTNLFEGKEQLKTSDAKFIFCIAKGATSDGGFLIIAERTDGSDQIKLNANNNKTGW